MRRRASFVVMADEAHSRGIVVAAVLLAAGLLAVSVARSSVAGKAAAELEARRAAAQPTAATPGSDSATRATTGATLRLEVQAAMAASAIGPPLVLRLRAREGATRPFDLTAREERPRQHFTLALQLPVQDPELPLRVELVGSEWCLPPGLATTTISRLDAPFRLGLLRARRDERLFQIDGTGAPLAGVAIVHESGATLGVSGADGRATFVRPQIDSNSDLLFAVADGHATAYLESARSGTLVLLRPAARGGKVAGRLLDASGAPVVGARLIPAYHVSDELPADPAARALVMALQASSVRELPVLTVRSDGEGRFELPLAWPGRLVVRAVERTLGTVVGELPAAPGMSDGGRVTPLELRFPAQVDVRLELTRAGVPVAGVAVELITRDAAGERAVAAGVCDAHGTLTLRAPCVTPLWALLRAEHQAATVHALALAASTATASTSGAPHVEPLEFAAGRAVKGTLADLPPVERGVRVVQLHDADSQLLLAEATVDFAGRFRFEQAAVGRALRFSLTEPGATGVPFLTTTLEPAPDDAAAGSSEVDLGTRSIPASGG